MTDPTGTPPAAPAPGDPTAPPAAEPAKSGGKGKLIGTIVLVLIAVGFIAFRFVLPMIEQSKFKVGACVDYYPVAISESNIDPKVVDCSDSAAKSEITEVLETTDVEQCAAPATAGIQIDSKMYCIVEK
jgi:hypothetical protein